MKVHRFLLSGGESIVLNDAQLYALRHMPAQYVSWPTYWALRRRKLITGPQHYIRTDLTERGKEVVAIDNLRRGVETKLVTDSEGGEHD